MPIKTAIILAGGLGTRLRPVTYEIPKPLIPIRGRTLTEHVIDKIKEADTQKIYLSIGYMSDKIIKYFKNKDLGVKIEFIVEKEPLGTGGCLHLLTKSQIKEDFDSDFIVVNGDDLFDLNWANMHKFHKANNALITIALTRVEDVTKFGVMDMDGKRIKRFVEKPAPGQAPSHYISGGYYIFSKEVLTELPKQEKFMLERDLFPKIAEKGRLFGYTDDEKSWMTTNSFEEWENVMKNWKAK